eukprot:scaffold55543_cov66-Phaeocystis_antarctica.AAC.3
MACDLTDLSHSAEVMGGDLTDLSQPTVAMGGDHSQSIIGMKVVQARTSGLYTHVRLHARINWSRELLGRRRRHPAQPETRNGCSPIALLLSHERDIEFNALTSTQPIARARPAHAPEQAQRQRRE